MDEREVAQYWNENAPAWTELSRAGYDVYRDTFNTPGFFDILPPISGLLGIDIGCGDGHNTRLLARAGAQIEAIDISEVFIEKALEIERTEPLGIRYRVASASALPFGDSSFDFATAFMSFMDMPGIEHALAEVHRVLRPGGFLQFSVNHPCFDTLHRRKVFDPNGNVCAIELGGYYAMQREQVEEWTFTAAPPEVRERVRKFRVPYFRRTLSEWLNLLIDTGFSIERAAEPRPTDEAVRAHPNMQDAQVAPYFLHLLVRKPSGRGSSR